MKAVFLIGALSVGLLGNSQSLKSGSQPTNKGIIYFSVGSHRIFYTPSDITVKRRGGPVFDFTLYDVKAHDEGGVRFHTAPEFSYEGGYYFTKKGFGLEYHYDHIKYFVQLGQRVHLKGSIGNDHYDTDTALTADFFKMEHSDGGNYAMVNLVKWITLAQNRAGSRALNLVLKAGIGAVNPKTNSTILGIHRDDKYHISGFVTGIETGLRYNFFKHLFFSGTFKGVYANYSQFLISNGYGHQKWLSVQVNYQLGGQFFIK